MAGISWIQNSVRTIVIVCSMIAIIECAADDGAFDGSFRLVCGAVAASSILQLFSALLQRLF